VLVPGVVFALFAGTYYWLPKWTGHMYNECLGKWHFWLSTISVNILFMPMHFVGLAGMPRRIPDYALQFTNFNMIITVGGFIFGISQLLFAWNVIRTIRGGNKVDARVWEGSHGLEWTLPSPPPYHSFTTPPNVH
jgi:cytochrome c oxidase subunit 1